MKKEYENLGYILEFCDLCYWISGMCVLLQLFNPVNYLKIGVLNKLNGPRLTC
jgi:hypothetical protein